MAPQKMSSPTAEKPRDLGFAGLLHRAIQPVDNASVTFFRIAFGFVMAYWGWDYLMSGRVTELYVRPAFHFSYYGFDWVRPWPGNGMYYHFIGLVLLALAIAAGLWYRITSLLFAIGFTYFFLLDRTNYQNHYYLVGLFSWWLPFLPLHRNVSVDARRNPRLASQYAPRWALWVLQFHVALPYFYGAIAKLSPDWFLGQPLGIMLAGKSDLPILGPWLAWPLTTVLFMAFGILYDLFVVPALLWKKTRVLAFLASIAFHLANSCLFSIHIFPWFMLAATTLFFSPSWPREVLAGRRLDDSDLPAASPWRWTVARTGISCLFIGYAVFHCLWPLRHNLYEGDASWNERGHLFAWRMMLRGKEVGIGYAIRDPAGGRIANVDHKRFLAPEQAEKFPRDPEMILHMAHFLADEFEAATSRTPEIYALVLTSLNGRKPQLMIDPNTDLVAQPRGVFWSRDWVPPLAEPLRSPPWDIPVDQWRQHIELPEINFLKSMQAQHESRPDTAPPSS